MVRTDLTQALSLNPWAVLVMAQAVVVTGWIAAAPQTALSFWQRHKDVVLVGNIAVAVSIWAVRIWSGAIPTPF
jgi:hypothetical protein